MNFTIPATSKRIITIVVFAIAINVTLCISTMAYCLINKIYPDGTLFTAFVGVTGGLVGALTGLLANTRSTPGSDADMPKGTLVPEPPTPVELKQPIGTTIKTTETKSTEGK